MIKTGNYDFLDLEDRTVTKYQFEYYDYLENKGLTNQTIKMKLDTFRALLGEYDISTMGKKFYRIHLDEDVAQKLDIVCAVKNQNPSEYIGSLLVKQFDKLNTENLQETIDDIKKI